MNASSPRICCLDLDTFFVSVERLLDPSLVGKAVVVGGQPGDRGVVSAASYEVRAFGVHSGMALSEAARLAPDAIFVPTTADVYGDYAARVREIARRYSPVVEVASIDEMFLDFRGCERLFARDGDPGEDATIERAVTEMTADIATELGLPSSAGIATTRTMAKVASVLAKPAGVLMVAAGREAATLAPLPVRRLPGIGPVAEAKLTARGIETLGQLAETRFDVLAEVFGSWASSIQQGARGQGSADLSRDRPAFRESDPAGQTLGSISNEHTFPRDVRDPAAIDAMLSTLVERVCWRARKRGVKARTISLKLRYADFETLSRSHTIEPTSSDSDVMAEVRSLYRKAHTRTTAVRLLGVGLSKLGLYDEQQSLFDEADPLCDTVDSIRHRFGYNAVRRARSRAARRGPGPENGSLF